MLAAARRVGCRAAPRRRVVAPGPGATRGQHLLVLLRHGQSEWNASKRFTGWVDVDLSEQGREEAIHAGIMLKRHGFEFDEAHTSLLKRAVRTLWSSLHCCDQHWIPVHRSWRLNERHYGALTGMSKQEVKDQMGEELLAQFRRGFHKRPIEMRPDHPFFTGRDRRYQHLGQDHLPAGESLHDCQRRVLPYWVDAIVPAVKQGKRVLVCAHNNVLRCLVQHLDRIEIANIREFEIPTGIPLIYRLSDDMQPIGKPDAIGFTGKFLIDAHKRDAEYLANIEALHTFGSRFDRVVRPVEAMTPEVIERECEEMNLPVPEAWVVEEGADAAAPPRPVALDRARMTPPVAPSADVKQNLGH